MGSDLLGTIKPMGDLMFKVLEYLADSKKKTTLLRVIRERMLRELRFNLALLSGINSLIKKKTDPLAVDQRFNMIQQLSTASFDVLVESGIALDDLMPGDLEWNEKDNRYRQRVSKDQTNSDLLERAYHIFRMQKIYAENRIEKRDDSLHYAIWLCQSVLERMKNNVPQ